MTGHSSARAERSERRAARGREAKGEVRGGGRTSINSEGSAGLIGCIDLRLAENANSILLQQGCGDAGLRDAPTGEESVVGKRQAAGRAAVFEHRYVNALRTRRLERFLGAVNKRIRNVVPFASTHDRQFLQDSMSAFAANDLPRAGGVSAVPRPARGRPRSAVLLPASGAARDALTAHRRRGSVLSLQSSTR